MSAMRWSAFVFFCFWPGRPARGMGVVVNVRWERMVVRGVLVKGGS